MFESVGMENRAIIIYDNFEEQTAVDIDVCSEDIPIHVSTSALASNKETTGKGIFCIAMFYIDC